MSFFRNKNFWFYFLVTVIIAGGIFIRFWQLGTIPPGVHYDEAYNGLNALWANDNHDWKVFYPENTGREGLHINAIAFFIHIFGNNNIGLRTANALWGSLTIIGFFFLLRELKFSRISILIGTFMIATSFWHLVFSRTAYRAIMVPLVLVWMFYFFWKAINNPRRRFINFAIAGIILGIGFHTYIAFRIAPLVIVIVGLSLLFTKKGFLKNYWKYIAFFGVAFLISTLPIIVYFSDHFKDFISRSEAVSVFNAPKGMTFAQAFWKSLSAHLWAFFTWGDPNPRHNFSNQPLLPAAWAMLFGMGFIVSLREIFKTLANVIRNYRNRAKENFLWRSATRWFYPSILAQAIFWVMLMPGVFTIEGIPHSLRIIGTIPGVFILSILPLEYIMSFFEEAQKSLAWKKNRLITVFSGLILMVAFGGFSQVYTYFNLWANDLATQNAYERKLYDAGLLVKDLPLHKNNYLITAWNTNIYPDKKQTSLKTTEYISYEKIKSYSFYRPMDGFSQISCDDPQLVFLESDQWLRNQYKNTCPDLKAKRYLYDDNKYIFWVMNYGN